MSVLLWGAVAVVLVGVFYARLWAAFLSQFQRPRPLLPQRQLPQQSPLFQQQPRQLPQQPLFQLQQSLFQPQQFLQPQCQLLQQSLPTAPPLNHAVLNDIIQLIMHKYIHSWHSLFLTHRQANSLTYVDIPHILYVYTCISSCFSLVSSCCICDMFIHVYHHVLV
jgi:hypothetical protein